MSDLMRLERSRASCKSWLQREVSKLQTILDSKQPDATELEITLGEFHRRLASWNAAQAAVEAKLEDDQLEEDLATAGDFRDACLSVQATAASFVTSLPLCPYKLMSGAS